ncbi:MAG: PHP-associated domain-containing protein [Candidatus Acidiferrales bacterium]|jgi:predicted metal-dependent phosphoesterase TrpH
MKCDLHIHSRFSGPSTMPVLKAFCLESYSEPEEVHSVLKQRGMDLVTLTDHDSLDGCEALRAHADFFASEEVTCRMPSGTEAHIGVYDLTPRQHVEIQRRRTDLPALLAYLGEQDLFFSVNHIFSALTGARKEEDFRWFMDEFPAFETLNGHMLPETNRLAARLARRTEKISLGGSDAHTTCAAAAAYTEVPGAANRAEFMAGLRRGFCRARGSSGSYAQTTRVALRVVWEVLREERWTAVLAPLAMLVPAFAYGNFASEQLFARRWARRIAPPRRRRRNGRAMRPSLRPVGMEKTL